jgi:hypothetical protein
MDVSLNSTFVKHAFRRSSSLDGLCPTFAPFVLILPNPLSHAPQNFVHVVHV